MVVEVGFPVTFLLLEDEKGRERLQIGREQVRRSRDKGKGSSIAAGSGSMSMGGRTGIGSRTGMSSVVLLPVPGLRPARRGHGNVKVLFTLFIVLFLVMAAAGARASRPDDAVAAEVRMVEANEAATKSNSGDRVIVRADDFIQFIAGGKEIIARGNVQVRHRNVVINSDGLKYVPDEEVAHFYGNVEVQQDEQYLRGEYVRYDLKKGRATVEKARAVVTSQGVKGNVYLRGDSIEMEEDVIFVHGGSLTTCNLDKPHYHLQAKELVIYPGDKVVVHNVSFWEGRIPLFYWPYMVISLGRERESAFELPRIGYSESEGWFVKTAYNYFRHPQSYGKVHLDYMQKKGIGTGVDHTYYDRGEEKKGQISVYRLQNPDTGATEWEGSWVQSFQLNPTVHVKLGTDYWLQPATGNSDDLWELEPEIELKKHSNIEDYSIGVKYRQYEGLQDEMELDATWNYTRRFTDQWQLITKGEYERNSTGEEPAGYLAYESTALRRTSRDQLSLKLEQDVHASLRDSNYSGSVTWETLQRMPEVTWQSRNWRLRDGWLPVALRLSGGRYRETYPGDEALTGSKFLISGGIDGKRINWGSKAYITYDGSIELDWYRDVYKYNEATGDPVTDPLIQEEMSRIVVMSRPRLVYRPVQPLTLELGYKDQWVINPSPFVFDELENSETLSGKITWRTKRFGVSLSSGYDFYDGDIEDVVGQVHVRPSDRYEINVRGTYDVEGQSFKTARGVVNLAPRDNLHLQVASTYNFTDERWERFDGRLQIELPRRWRLDYVLSYSGATREWIRSDAVLALDLHCREVRLRYDQLNKAIWLEYSIKAFPQTRLKLGASEEEIDFSVEGLDALVQ